MTQKIFKVGSSAAVTISSQTLKELGLKIGDEVKTAFDPTTGSFVVKSAEPGVIADKELLDWTKKFITQYRPALEALAKK